MDLSENHAVRGMAQEGGQATAAEAKAAETKAAEDEAPPIELTDEYLKVGVCGLDIRGLYCG